MKWYEKTIHGVKPASWATFLIEAVWYVFLLQYLNFNEVWCMIYEFVIQFYDMIMMWQEKIQI